MILYVTVAEDASPEQEAEVTPPVTLRQVSVEPIGKECEVEIS